MIVFDLRCRQGHVFESWFASSRAFSDQQAQGLVCCPICGDPETEKAVMAPNVGAKGNRKSVPAAKSTASEPPSPDAVKAAMAMLAKAQAAALEKSEWVGSAFADRARAMHLGEAETAPIHGQASAEQARALKEEGVPVAPLPFPVPPPESRN